MSKTAFAAAAIGAALLGASPAAAAQGGSGPFTGVVRQNQVRVHHYDNNPQNLACPQVMTTYTVTVTYTPPTDTLTLSVGSLTATGSDGVASLTFEGNHCTAFDIRVTGTSVQTVSHYTVTVSRGGGAVAI